VLLDAPVAVGWARWREIDAKHAFGQLRLGVEAAAAAGALPPDDVDGIAHALLASLLELALKVAQASKPRRALDDAKRAIELLVNRLLRGTPQ
jgi:hypothetical protein